MSNKIINAEHKIKVSEETREEIFKHVEENYKEDVKQMIYGKKCWRQIGLSFETMSKVTVAVGGVLSFSSGYFNSNMLSFISGSISVISLALLQFGAFGFRQAKKRGNDLNVLLKKLDLDTVPVMDDDPEALVSGNNKTVIDKGVLRGSDEDICNSISDAFPEEKSQHKLVSEISKDINKSPIDTKNIDLELTEPSPKNTNNIKIIEDIKHEITPVL